MKVFTVEEVTTLIEAELTALKLEQDTYKRKLTQAALGNDADYLLEHSDRRSLTVVAWCMLMYPDAFAIMLDMIGRGEDDDVVAIELAFDRARSEYADANFGISDEEAREFVRMFFAQPRQVFEAGVLSAR